MGLRQLTNPKAYLKLLREDPEEIEALFNDVLIQVTRFFREPKAWSALNRLVLARLVKDARNEAGVRAWVPGCATGEEAYTMGMLLLEQRERVRKNFPIQIFASDLDHKSLETGRAGHYLENNLVDVSPERVQRFFESQGNGYRVRQELRDIVVFAHHNVLTDPPFSRMDLISCRSPIRRWIRRVRVPRL
jgi:two-component system CheB/CheR fusion protein